MSLFQQSWLAPSPQSSSYDHLFVLSLRIPELAYIYQPQLPAQSKQAILLGLSQLWRTEIEQLYEVFLPFYFVLDMRRNTIQRPQRQSKIYSWTVKHADGRKKREIVCEEWNWIEQLKYIKKIMEGTEANVLNLQNRNDGQGDTYSEMIRPVITREGLRKSTVTGFELANWEKACEEKKRESNRYYKGEEVSSFVGIDHFKMYGPGIYLFFKFIWDASMLFLALTFISLIPMIYNYVEGNAWIYSAQTMPVTITRLTIGAHYYPELQFTTSNPYETSIKHKLFNVIPDIVTCFIFLAFYMYWVHMSDKIVKEIRKEVLFPSYYAVEVSNLPSGISSRKMEDFMEQFGKVSEVAPVKYYAEKIDLCKKIYQTEMDIKELNIDMVEGSHSKHEEKIQRLNEQIEQYTVELNQVEQENSEEYIKFFVSYETIEERDQAVKAFQPYQKCSCICCRKQPPEELLLEGHQMKVKGCDVQPGGLIWENIHVTWRQRWARMLFQTIILLVVIAGGFILVSFLNISVASQKFESIDTSTYTATDIQSQTNQTIVESWCIKNTDTINTDAITLCTPYWQDYNESQMITTGISILLVVIQLIVKVISTEIARFQRFTTHTHQYRNMVINLFVTYFTTTVLITFLMQAQFWGFSFKSIIEGLVQDSALLKNISILPEFSDFTHDWYLEIGYQIWFNFLMLAFVPHVILPLGHLLLEKVTECFARRETLQKNMTKKLRAEQFQFQDHYAHVLLIVFVGFVFSGPMPLMLFTSFLALISRYIYFRIAFVRFSRVPPAMNEALNDEAIRILPPALIVHCAFSIFAYGGADIFVSESSFLFQAINGVNINFIEEIATIVYRLINTWYLTLMMILFIVVIVLKALVIDFIIKAVNKEGQNKETVQDQSIDLDVKSQRTLAKSYKLQKNPDYFQILAIMKMMDKKRERIKRGSIQLEQLIIPKQNVKQSEVNKPLSKRSNYKSEENQNLQKNTQQEKEDKAEQLKVDYISCEKKSHQQENFEFEEIEVQSLQKK